MESQSVSGVRVLFTILLFCAILGGIAFLAFGGGGRLTSLRLGFVGNTAKPPAGTAAPTRAPAAGDLQAQAAAFADVPLPQDLATCISLLGSAQTNQIQTVCTRAINPWQLPAQAAIADLPAVKDYEEALHMDAWGGAGDMTDLETVSPNWVLEPLSYYRAALRSLAPHS